MYACSSTLSFLLIAALAATVGVQCNFVPAAPLANLPPARDARLDRIVVVGDLHGDMAQTLAVLRVCRAISIQEDFYRNELGRAALVWLRDGYRAVRHGGLSDDINRNMVYNKRGHLMQGSRADAYHWSAGPATLVLLGDAMNVGPDDIDILYFIKRLSQEAADAGGRVIFLLGNHELQNLQGDYSGVHPWSFERSGGREGRTLLLSMKTSLGRFLRGCPVLHYERGLLFVHGGVISDTVHMLRRLLPNGGDQTVEQVVHHVNRAARRVLESWTSTKRGEPLSESKDPVATFILDYRYKTTGKDLNPVLVHPLDQCEAVKEANKLLHISAQVVGHTPHAPPIYDFCDGELLALDFGMSQWKGGDGSSFAALQLEWAPRRHNHTHGPARGHSVWHTSLVVPDSGILAVDVSDALEHGVTWRVWVMALVLSVLLIELCLCYCRRKCCTPAKPRGTSNEAV